MNSFQLRLTLTKYKIIIFDNITLSREAFNCEWNYLSSSLKILYLPTLPINFNQTLFQLVLTTCKLRKKLCLNSTITPQHIHLYLSSVVSLCWCPPHICVHYRFLGISKNNGCPSNDIDGKAMKLKECESVHF